MSNFFISFSDAAKFALVARNLVQGNGYITDFSFWGGNFFSTGGIPRLLPYLISIFFKIFGISDFAVISFSFFFFLLLVAGIYLLGNKLHSKLVGVLSALVVAFNPDFLNYALTGASETLFAFEIVIGSYFILLKKRWATLCAFLILVAMYFTRPQAFVFMGTLVLLWLLVNLGIKKGIYYFLGLSVFSYLFDRFILYRLSFILPVTSVFGRGFSTIFTYSSSAAVSDSLRGGPLSTLSGSEVFKKVFYNIYNFYKAIPEIYNPYVFAVFLIGLFIKIKDKSISSFKIVSVFSLVLTFLVTALSIPFYRYLHPVYPFVAVFFSYTLVTLISKFEKDSKKIWIYSLVLVAVFVVGQTLSKYILDTRFENRLVNKGKPPMYVLLSYELKSKTDENDMVLTNLDTWGSWYGERKTVWYPLTVSQFVERIDEFSAIYLTSYKKDDDNYYMGDDWRLIYANPYSPEPWVCGGCDKISEQFELKDVFYISPEENYEKEEGIGVLLKRIR